MKVGRQPAHRKKNKVFWTEVQLAGAGDLEVMNGDTSVETTVSSHVNRYYSWRTSHCVQGG